MKIAIYSDNFFPEISGITDSIITTGQELVKRGHEIVYIAPKYSKKNYRYIASADGEHSPTHDARKDLPVHRLPSLTYPYSPTSQSRLAIPLGTSIPFLRKFKPDVIHTHMPFGAGFEALFASKILGTPLVGTNHTPIEEFIAYTPLIGKPSAHLARRFFAWYYNRCVFVTAPYNGIIEDMRKMKFNKNAQVVPNPILLNTFNQPSKEQKIFLKEKYGFRGPTILYSGRLAPEKHIDVIIKAIKQIVFLFPNLTLLITGHGVAQEKLKKLTRKLAIEKNVRFSGFVSIERLVEFYQAVDVFVIMSTAETQSLALMQAFSSGVPAVAAKARALARYVPENCGFLVEPGDEIALAEKLRQLFCNEKLRKQMGENGAKFVQNFSPDKIADIWEKIYEQNKKRT